MTAEPERHPSTTVEEYFELEASSPIRHEYVAGVMHALAGASKRHNRIAVNIARPLGNAAGPCRVYVSDVRLRTAADDFYYPDVMVASGPEGGHPLVEEAPCLVVEVASPSTATTDRREKLAAYKRLPSLHAYLVADQDRRRVQRFWRDDEGVWWDAEVAEEGNVPIPQPPITLTLAEIYAGIDFDRV
jgi:Uma2 family endonuclease